MDKISPKVPLIILVGILATDVPALCSQHGKLFRPRLKFERPIYIVIIIKCISDIALVTLQTLNFAKIIDRREQGLKHHAYWSDWQTRLEEWFRLAIELLLRCSIISVVLREVCLLSNAWIKVGTNIQSQLLLTWRLCTRVQKRCGKIWRNVGPISILSFTLVKLLPLLEYDDTCIVVSYILIWSTGFTTRPYSSGRYLVQVPWTFCYSV